MNKAIKYMYAFNSFNNLVAIQSVPTDKANRTQKYICIACRTELIPKIGKIKQPHFAHKNIANCSTETYLHILGKKVFKEAYHKCLHEKKPYQITLKGKAKCNVLQSKFAGLCMADIEETFDLTQYFNELELEKRDDNFIPDLLLKQKNRSEKIYIEIAVTHQSSTKKLDSKIRLIEFKLESENDLNLISQCHINWNNEKIKVKNFKTKEQDINFPKQNIPCPVYNWFIVYNSGKCIMLNYSPCDFSKKYLQMKPKIKIFKRGKAVFEDDLVSSLTFQKYIKWAYLSGHLKKNCYLCRYHGTSYYSCSGGIFCKFLKLNCDSNKALECEFFRPDKQLRNKETHS